MVTVMISTVMTVRGTMTMNLVLRYVYLTLTIALVHVLLNRNHVILYETMTNNYVKCGRYDDGPCYLL